MESIPSKIITEVVDCIRLDAVHTRAALPRRFGQQIADSIISVNELQETDQECLYHLGFLCLMSFLLYTIDIKIGEEEGSLPRNAKKVCRNLRSRQPLLSPDTRLHKLLFELCSNKQIQQAVVANLSDTPEVQWKTIITACGHLLDTTPSIDHR